MYVFLYIVDRNTSDNGKQLICLRLQRQVSLAKLQALQCHVLSVGQMQHSLANKVCSLVIYKHL